MCLGLIEGDLNISGGISLGSVTVHDFKNIVLYSGERLACFT